MLLSVLVVDDHDGFQAVARAMLETEKFVVVGEAVDGAGDQSHGPGTGPRIILMSASCPLRPAPTNLVSIASPALGQFAT